MSCKSEGIGNDISRVALYVIIDDIVASCSIVDAVVAVSLAARLVRRDSVLSSRELSTVSHKNEAHHHLVLTLTREGIAAGVLGVVCEVDASSIGSWIREANVKSVFTPIDQLRICGPSSMKEMFHDIVDTFLGVLSEHSLKFIDELFVNDTVVDLVYSFDDWLLTMTRRTTKNRRLWKHGKPWVRTCKWIGHPDSATPGSYIDRSRCFHYLFVCYPIECCQKLLRYVIVVWRRLEQPLNLEYLARLNGQVLWWLESTQEVPPCTFLFDLECDLRVTRIIHTDQVGSLPILLFVVKVEHMLLSIEDNCLGHVLLPCNTFFVAGTNGLGKFPLYSKDFLVTVVG